MFPKKFSLSPIRLAVVALAIGAIVLVLASCGSSSDASTSSRAEPNRTTTSTTAGASGASVDLKLIAYKPAALTVNTDTTVTWHQMDPGVHTVTSGTVSQNGGSVTPAPDGTFDSGELATGTSFSRRFDTPGTYTYFCEIHPATMRGEVTVR